MKISINFNIKKFFLILLLFLGLFVIDIIWLELIPVKWLLKVLFAIVILSIIMISVITFMLRKAVKVGIGKQVFVGLLLIIIGIIAQGLFFYSGKFKFEAFKNQKEVRNYFEKHYLIGSDANIVLSDLKEIGASCVVDKNKLKEILIIKMYTFVTMLIALFHGIQVIFITSLSMLIVIIN